MSESREGYLDFLRGIAIILVVAGHYLQASQVAEDNILLRVIYAFHMPLFMFIAGLAAAKSRSFGNVQTTPSLDPWLGFRALPAKAFRLLIPFAAWGAVRYIVSWSEEATAPEFMLTLLRQPDVGLWFLPALFIIFVALALQRTIFSFVVKAVPAEFRTMVLLATFGLCWAMLMSLRSSYLLYLSAFYFPFVCAGLLFGRVRMEIPSWVAPCAISAFAILLPLWHRTSADPRLLMLIGESHSVAVRFAFGNLIAWLGILGAMPLTAWLSQRVSWSVREAIQFTGMHTLGIYAIHLYVLEPDHGPMSIMIAILVSLTGDWLLRQNPWTQAVMLGEKWCGHPVTVEESGMARS